MMSRSLTPLAIAAALAVLSAAASAQPVDRDAEFAAALAAGRASVPTPSAAAKPAAAKPAAAPARDASCPDAKELETSFELRVISAKGRALDLHFDYKGCRTEGRNDYLPPYTERDYEARDGYGLTIVTDDGRSESEVLLAKGAEWIGRFGKQENAKLVSGEELPAGEVVVDQGGVQVKSSAMLRATDGVFAQTRVCDEGIKKLAGYSPRNSLDKVSTGFTPGPSLVLLTGSDAFYYHEDCDICAELDACDLKTGATRVVITAHSVSCSDLDGYRMERGEVFSACGPSPR